MGLCNNVLINSIYHRHQSHIVWLLHYHTHIKHYLLIIEFEGDLLLIYVNQHPTNG